MLSMFLGSGWCVRRGRRVRRVRLSLFCYKDKVLVPLGKVQPCLQMRQNMFPWPTPETLMLISGSLKPF